MEGDTYNIALCRVSWEVFMHGRHEQEGRFYLEDAIVWSLVLGVILLICCG